MDKRSAAPPSFGPRKFFLYLTKRCANQSLCQASHLRQNQFAILSGYCDIRSDPAVEDKNRLSQTLSRYGCCIEELLWGVGFADTTVFSRGGGGQPKFCTGTNWITGNPHLRGMLIALSHCQYIFSPHLENIPNIQRISKEYPKNIQRISNLTPEADVRFECALHSCKREMKKERYL